MQSIAVAKQDTELYSWFINSYKKWIADWLKVSYLCIDNWYVLKNVLPYSELMNAVWITSLAFWVYVEQSIHCNSRNRMLIRVLLGLVCYVKLTKKEHRAAIRHYVLGGLRKCRHGMSLFYRSTLWQSMFLHDWFLKSIRACWKSFLAASLNKHQQTPRWKSDIFTNGDHWLISLSNISMMLFTITAEVKRF